MKVIAEGDTIPWEGDKQSGNYLRASFQKLLCNNIGTSLCTDAINARE